MDPAEVSRLASLFCDDEVEDVPPWWAEAQSERLAEVWDNEDDAVYDEPSVASGIQTRGSDDGLPQEGE